MVHMHVRHVAVAAAMFATAQEQKSGPRLGKERPLVTSRDLGGRSKGGVPPLARSHNVPHYGTNSHGTHLKLAQRGAAQRYGRASRGSDA